VLAGLEIVEGLLRLGDYIVSLRTAPERDFVTSN
jgi:hypothetical protein